MYVFEGIQEGFVLDRVTNSQCAMGLPWAFHHKPLPSSGVFLFETEGTAARPNRGSLLSLPLLLPPPPLLPLLGMHVWGSR